MGSHFQHPVRPVAPEMQLPDGEREEIMLNIRNVLFPVDFSRCSVQAAAQVREMASRVGARVTLLNTIEIPKGWYTSVEVEAFAAMVNMDELRQTRQQKLDEFAAHHFAGLPAQTLLKQGDPADVILECVKSESADLIMMPTQGCGLIRRTMLGSVTAKVLHKAPCPVWTAAHVEQAPHIANGAPKVLCALDLKESSMVLLRQACTLASKLGAELEAVHVVPLAGMPSDPSCSDQLRPFLLSVAHERMKKVMEEAGINVPCHYEEGSIAHGIRNAVTRLRGTIVVIGRGHVATAIGGLRTKVFGIIGECPAPVISFPN